MSVPSPFERGPHPVGTRELIWSDETRSRTLPTQVWYPATAAHQGQDLDPATQDSFRLAGSMGGDGPKRQAAVADAEPAAGEFPVIVFSHGFAGDRREFSHLCTHLASHGYRVISPDHPGTTFTDIQEQLDGGAFNLHEALPWMAEDRYGDIPFLLDMAEQEFGAPIERAGCTGVSFGGWTAVCAPALDARIVATAPMCPGGVDGPTGTGERNTLGRMLRYDWQADDAAMLLLVGDRDSWLPLFGQMSLFAQCPGTSNRLAVMQRADHQHFTDDMPVAHEWFRTFQHELAQKDRTPNGPPWSAVAAMMLPFADLMPEVEAQQILTGFITHHMDTHLKGMDGGVPDASAALRRQARERDLDVFFVEI